MFCGTGKFGLYLLPMGLAEAKMTEQRHSQSSAGQASQRSRIMSSEPPVPSSDRDEPEPSTPRPQEPNEIDWCQEVQKRQYRVRPFGLDATINMRELNPSGMLCYSLAMNLR